MSRRAQRMFKVVGIIIVIIAIGTIGFNIYKEKEAIQIAQEYLLEKYEQEMSYLSVWFSWVDPSLYHVYFFPQNNSELIFEVMVSNDLKEPEERINSYGQHFSPDNYYLRYFEWLLAQQFNNSIKKAWGNNAYAQVRVPNHALYSFTVPAELSDELALDEMVALVDDYLILIDTSQELNEANKLHEAEKILIVIQSVQQSGYEPENLVFWYNTLSSDRNKHISLGFTDWASVFSTKPVLERIEEALEVK